MLARLPTIAERHFALRCAEEGITCNPSTEDNAGWDFVIHLPRDVDAQSPRDEQHGPHTAFVQVKSTGNAPFTVELKLSNALRMAQERSPYFIVLIVGSGAARRYLVRHFWAAEIEATLKRVRQAEASGHSNQLHRRKLTLSLSEQDDHTIDLLPWMSETIGSAGRDYHAAKAAITDSIGYEHSSTKLIVSVAGSYDEIGDWELGLIPLPTVTSVKATTRRFGVELPSPAVLQKASLLTVKPAGQDCFIQLKSGPTSINLMGKLFFTTVDSLIPSRRAWRADFGFLQLIWRSETLSGNLSLDFRKYHTLDQLAELAAIASWAGSDEVRATLFVEGTRTDLGQLEFNESSDSDHWTEIASWINTLITIAREEPGCDPRISFIELFDAAVWLKRFHELFAGKAVRIEHPASIEDDPTHAIIYMLRCDVGSWSFFAVVRRTVAVDTVVDQTRTLYLMHSELLSGFVGKGSWEDNAEHVEASYAGHISRMGDPTFFWDLGDMEHWLGRLHG